MTDVTSSANKIQVEEVDFTSPIGESVLTRIAGSINYALDRNATYLELDGSGYHRQTQLNDIQSYHYIDRNSIINAYILTNQINGSAGAISVNAAVFDEDGIFLNNLFSVAPEIDSAIATAGTTGRYSIGRYVEDNENINAGTSKIVGTLNFTELNKGYFLRFFTEEIQTNGASFRFRLRLREID